MTYYSDQVVLPTTPVAYWRLNERSSPASVQDYSGNNCTGTPSGGVTFASEIGPDNDFTPVFNGTTGYINVLSAAFSSVFSGEVGSLMVWMKADPSILLASSIHIGFTAYTTTSVLDRVSIEKNGVSNFGAFRCGSSSCSGPNGALPDSEWHCVILTWDENSKQLRSYIDGSLFGIRNAITPWSGAALTVARIGAFDLFQWWWKGSLAHIAVWDYVLTKADVIALSDASAPVTPPPPIPTEIYDIKVYDHTGTLQLILQKWHRLEFHQRINASWNHQITIEYGYDDPDLAVIRGIKPDWIIEVYRLDPVTLVRSKVYEGFNTTVVDQVRANGGIIINLYGVGYTQLLQRRIVLPLVGEEYNAKTDIAETVMKSFVSDSMVSPTDTTRTFSGVSIAGDLLTGEQITYSARYINLLSVCETCSERGNLDFGIYGGGEVGTFVFDARDVWGIDSRISNSDGNVPIIFSIERDNMLIPILSLNNSSEQNYMYVGGDGQGADRVIEEVSDSTAIAVSPWSRKEAFIEARQQSSTDALIATGNEELQKRKAKQSLSFNIKQTDQSRWIRDWNLGDLISAKYYEYIFDKQIVEIGVVVTSGQTASNYEVITVEFEDVRL